MDRISTRFSARLWFAFYQILLVLAWPFVYLRLWLRSRREPEYGQRVSERTGRVPAATPTGAVWFHTVSAGETIAAVPVIEWVCQHYPHHPVLVTTTTPTGSAEVQKRLGSRVAHCYAPYDFPWAVARFFDRVQPRIAIIMETELWPNMIRAAQRRRIPVALINGRLSERSAAGYRRVAGLTEPMLHSLTVLACQTEDHAKRFQNLGARRAEVVGNVKFDTSLSDATKQRRDELAQRWQLDQRAVWIAASTHPGEDETLLDAHCQIVRERADACLILVPRHPVRADEVAQLAKARNLEVAKQSECATAAPTVLIGDEMGSLLTLYGLSEIAFVGGSLVDRGGHNPIEPALWEQPMLMGASRFNFEEVCAEFAANGSLITVATADAIASEVLALIANQQLRQQLGRAGLAVVQRNQGALARTCELLRLAIPE